MGEHVTNQASLGMCLRCRSKFVGPPGHLPHRDPARQTARENLGRDRSDVPRLRATATEVVRVDPRDLLYRGDDDLPRDPASPRIGQRKERAGEEPRRRGYTLLGDRCEVRVQNGPFLRRRSGRPNGVGAPAPMKERIARANRALLGSRRLGAFGAGDDLMRNSFGAHDDASGRPHAELFGCWSTHGWYTSGLETVNGPLCLATVGVTLSPTTPVLRERYVHVPKILDLHGPPVRVVSDHSGRSEQSPS